jgi:hypothetical protein
MFYGGAVERRPSQMQRFTAERRPAPVPPVGLTGRRDMIVISPERCSRAALMAAPGPT